MAKFRTIAFVFFLVVVAQASIAIPPRPASAASPEARAAGFVPRSVSSIIGFDSLYGLGLDGSGIDIAVMDTGINGNHPDLKHGMGSSGSFISKNISFVPGHDHVDQDGHGTFIAGMLIGNGASSGGSIYGLVPGARLWNIRILSENGTGDESWAENALDWIISLPHKPDILSLSFGSATPMPGVESRIKQLWKDGVFVAVASGNDGPNYFTVNSPGNVLDITTVGACTDDKYLLTFSSQGPAPGTYYYKPDLVAFGEKLTSLSISAGYEEGTGTSFAVPFITAGVALLEEATNRTRTPDEIKAAVIDSCRSIGYSYFMEGAGLPNFSGALALLEDPSWNGTAVLPGRVVMPIKESGSSNVSIEKYMIEPTVILSKNSASISVEVEGDPAGAAATSLEDYEGAGDRQFAVKISVSATSPAFKSGALLVRIKHADGTVAAVITVQIESQAVNIVPIVTFVIITSAFAGLILFFTVAYKKGTRAVSMPQCEIDGTCPIK